MSGYTTGPGYPFAPSHWERWSTLGRKHNWTMDRSPWWLRMPVIRHLRYWLYIIAWASQSRALIAHGLEREFPCPLRTEWFLYGMWHGFEELSRD